METTATTQPTACLRHGRPDRATCPLCALLSGWLLGKVDRYGNPKGGKR